MKKENSKFLMCRCHGHALLVEKEEESNDISLSLFERSFTGKVLSWKERLRWCWHILRTGFPWTDYVILDEDNQKQLKDFLNNII